MFIRGETFCVQKVSPRAPFPKKLRLYYYIYYAFKRGVAGLRTPLKKKNGADGKTVRVSVALYKRKLNSA
jgi:hypothetical protein